MTADLTSCQPTRSHPHAPQTFAAFSNDPVSHTVATILRSSAGETAGASCALLGEDGTRCVLPRARIDPEYANPLYADEVAELWRRDAP